MVGDYRARHGAAFINAIHDEGTKAEAVEWLQRTWDDYVDGRAEIEKLRANIEQAKKWISWIDQMGLPKDKVKKINEAMYYLNGGDDGQS